MAGGYTPAFASLYTGTLYGKWPTAAVWASLLPLIDSRGHIEMTHEAIAGMTGWPIDLLRQGITELEQPDPGSRSAAEDGRRLVRLDLARNWGWRVVNVQKYRERASGRDQVTDGRNAEKVRRYKERHRKTPVDTAGHPKDTADTNSYSNTNTDSNKEKKPDRRTACAVDEPEGFSEVRQRYPKRAGGQRWGDAQKFFRRRIAEGEKVEVIVAGVQRYADFARATGIERTEKVQQAATFLGDNRGYLELWQPPPRALSAVEQARAKLREWNGNGDERVVSEQSGRSSETGVGASLGLLRRTAGS